MTEAAILDAARAFLRRGWLPVPVPRGSKAPILAEWQNLRLTEAELPERFSHDGNLGVILGEPSGGLVDIDLDAPEAVTVGPMFLPPTDRIHGRPGKPGSHYWYTASPPPRTEKFQDLDGAVLVELRSNGGQTVVPPSIHPSGERLFWGSEGEPAVVEGGALGAAVARTAAAALLARHWPAEGGRHGCSLPLAGFLLQGGTEEEAAVAFVEAVSQAAGDPEWRDRVRAVRDTARELAAGRPATGGPTLAELLPDGERMIHKLREWLGLRRVPDAATGPYRIEGGRICRDKPTREGVITVPLCNFAATVREEVIQDDGLETTRAFIIHGHLDTGEPLPPARVSAARFGAMTWVPDAWGLRAVVNAGQTTRDYLREAIQRLSPEAPQRRVFTHTGWRKINDNWIYLTAGGAVGHDGIEVDLGSAELARYCLPRTADDPVGAMRLSLRLLDLAPLTVTAPLWAGVFRAPLASALPLDLSIWIEGVTGSLKSTVAALFLSHFGTFTRLHLPGNWKSTANVLERRAFTLKDTILVIDEYAPSALDARELESTAARLIRSQGNLSGRGRLRADLTERPCYPPRGLIVSTGEQHPPGQSLLARMSVIEMDRAGVNIPALSGAQRMATRLPDAMVGYLNWLAPQMPNLPSLLRETFEGARAQAIADEDHLRVPEVLAHLWLGLHCGLSYAEESGACSAAEANAYRSRCWDALLTMGRAQARLVEEERPSRRFLRVLLALTTQRRAILLPKDGGPEDTGPLSESPLIGWYDDEHFYLIPEAAFAAASRFCREAGEPFPIREERLRRDLAREGLSICDPGRHTTTARIGEGSRRVLKLDRAAIQAALGEEFRLPSPPVTTITGYTG